MVPAITARDEMIAPALRTPRQDRVDPVMTRRNVVGRLGGASGAAPAAPGADGSEPAGKMARRSDNRNPTTPDPAAPAVIGTGASVPALERAVTPDVGTSVAASIRTVLDSPAMGSRGPIETGRLVALGRPGRIPGRGGLRVIAPKAVPGVPEVVARRGARHGQQLEAPGTA